MRISGAAIQEIDTLLVDTEMPAAAALTDATANPTIPTLGAAALLYNGTTWDRVRGDITNGLDVDVTRVTGTVTVDSELAAAILAADTMANMTVPQVLSNLMVFNGTTWDRLRTIRGGTLAGAQVGHLAVGKTEGKVTYRAVFADLAAPTGIAVTIIGSATTTVRVTRIQIAKPSVAQAPLRIRKYSTDHTAGTSTNATRVPLDSADAAATAVVRLYTVVPTAAGTLVGDLFDAGIGTSDVVYETFGDEQNAQAIVLRGVAENVTLQLSGAATLNGYIEWTEE